MTDQNNNPAKASRTPSHIAYHIREISDDKSFWTRIGSVWPHADGKGFSVQLDGLVPLDGRISLRIPSEKSE